MSISTEIEKNSGLGELKKRQKRQQRAKLISKLRNGGRPSVRGAEGCLLPPLGLDPPSLGEVIVLAVLG